MPDTALVCTSGHVANWHSGTQTQLNVPFCEKCGKETISKCPKCQADIRGAPNRFNPAESTPPPSFCASCGAPFPWTTARILAAKELADLRDEIAEADKPIMKTTIDDLVGDTVRTPIGITNFQRIMGKAGPVVRKLFVDCLAGIVSEAVAKALVR
jgi:hypothetical protein